MSNRSSLIATRWHCFPFKWQYHAARIYLFIWIGTDPMLPFENVFPESRDAPDTGCFFVTWTVSVSVPIDVNDTIFSARAAYHIITWWVQTWRLVTMFAPKWSFGWLNNACCNHPQVNTNSSVCLQAINATIKWHSRYHFLHVIGSV